MFLYRSLATPQQGAVLHEFFNTRFLPELTSPSSAEASCRAAVEFFGCGILWRAPGPHQWQSRMGATSGHPLEGLLNTRAPVSSYCLEKKEKVWPFWTLVLTLGRESALRRRKKGNLNLFEFQRTQKILFPDSTISLILSFVASCVVLMALKEKYKYAYSYSK